MPKIVVTPVTANGHGELIETFQPMIISAIQSAGERAVALESVQDLDGATHIIVAGVGTWGGADLENTLASAGRRGIRRVLWQMETLPPPDLPRTLSARLLLRNASHRVRGIPKTLDSLALKHLASKCRSLAWNQPIPLDTGAFRLPIREARYLKRLWEARLIDEILVCVESRQGFLATIGIPSTFMPFGYHETWGHPDPTITKDTDVLFIGGPTPRRAQLISALREALTDERRTMTIVERGLYGEARNRMIARSRIFLHFRNYPWELPRLRLMMAAAGRSLYVTEEFQDTKPFLSGQHFVMAPSGQLPSVILDYLKNDEAREQIVERIARFVVSDLDLGRLLLKVISQFRG
jgi:hypothetical protein